MEAFMVQETKKTNSLETKERKKEKIKPNKAIRLLVKEKKTHERKEKVTLCKENERLKELEKKEKDERQQ